MSQNTVHILKNQKKIQSSVLFLLFFKQKSTQSVGSFGDKRKVKLKFILNYLWLKKFRPFANSYDANRTPCEIILHFHLTLSNFYFQL